MAGGKAMAKDLVKTDTVLKAGLRMEFSILSESNTVVDKFYASRLQDFNSKEIIVDMPFNEQRVPIIPSKGDRIYGKIISRSCAYRFVALFLKAEAGSIPVWVLQKPPVVERFQNREYVRVKVTRPIIVHPIDDDGSMQSMVTTNTVDISGGGICFVLFSPLKVGNRVALDIDNLPDMELIQILGEVVRCHPVDVAGVELYHIGVKFIDLSSNERNKLVKFIFELQRRQLRMGVLNTED